MRSGTNDTSCRDLGVLLTNDLPYVHIGEIVRKGHQRANAILGVS